MSHPEGLRGISHVTSSYMDQDYRLRHGRAGKDQGFFVPIFEALATDVRNHKSGVNTGDNNVLIRLPSSVNKCFCSTPHPRRKHP